MSSISFRPNPHLHVLLSGKFISCAVVFFSLALFPHLLLSASCLSFAVGGLCRSFAECKTNATGSSAGREDGVFVQHGRGDDASNHGNPPFQGILFASNSSNASVVEVVPPARQDDSSGMKGE